MKEDKGLRYDQDKLRTDLLPVDVIEKLAEVLTVGANKYADRNWELGMKWSRVIGSLKRHLNAVELGKDYDDESGLRHIDHVLTNAAFLSRYYDTHPEYDDRPHKYLRQPRIALDIDGVLADFSTAFKERLGIKSENWNWLFSYEFYSGFQKVKEDKDFWLNLKPLVDPNTLNFEPIGYVTARQIPLEWTEEWLENNGFACVKAISTNGDDGVNIGNKCDALKSLDTDIFVDDAFETFVDLNNKGICTYLMNTPYNKKYDVGYKRLYDLNDLVK